MNNPVIQRELIGVLRGKPAALIQVLVLGILALLVIIRWPPEGRVDMSGRQSQQVIALFSYGLMTCILLLVPVYPATTIVRERRSGTLALLLNSPMTPLGIVFGKLVGVMGFAILLLVLSLPAAAACYSMGGIDLVDQVLAVYAVLALLALQYSTMGLLVSTYSATVDSALRTTYALTLVLSVVTLGPYALLQGLLSSSVLSFLPIETALQAANWLRAASPVPAMMELMGHGDLLARGLVSKDPLAKRFCIIAAGSSLVFFLWTVARVNQRLLDRARATGKITDERSGSVRLYRRMMYLYFFDPQRRSPLISDWVNPVLVKEFRTRRFGRLYWTIRLGGIALIVSLALMLGASQGTMDLGINGMAAVLVVLQLTLVILLTPSLASGLISGERESDGWQLLQSTRLSVARIVAGKLGSVMVTLGMILVATLPAYVVLGYIEVGTGQPTVIPQVVGTLFLTVIFTTLVSAAVSGFFRRTMPATTTAFGIIFMICAGTLLVWMARDAPFSHATVENVLRVNPVAAVLSLTRIEGFAHYRLLPYNWWFLGLGSLVSAVVLIVQTWRISRPV